MSPRILFIDHSSVLGGGELSLLDIARHFRDSSRVVLLEEGPFEERLQDACVDVHVIDGREQIGKVVREGGLMQDLRVVPGVLQVAARVARQASGFDVLYANSQKSMIVAALSGLLVRKPVVWHLRDLITTDHFSRTHCRLVTVFTNLFVNRVIANSQATREAIIAMGVNAERVFTVYNGIDETPFLCVTPDQATAVRAELGLLNVPTVGVFSRLCHWKGQHILVEALRDLPGVHALIVGGPLFQEDYRYEEALRRQVVEADLVDRVHFLGFRSDIPQLMHAVDVVVHTSTAPEPFGRVIAEGMLARKPVVATQAGGAQEIIQPGKTGWLVPAGDPATLREALAKLLTDHALAERLSEAGRQEALHKFSVRRLVHEVGEQLQQVAKKNGMSG